MTPREIEKIIRKLLEERFERLLPEREIQFGIGNGCRHRFDCVSDKNEIVCEVKACNFTTEQSYRTTQRWRILADYFLLEKLPATAKVRILVLTDKTIHRRFLEDFGAVLNQEKVRVEHIYLTPKT